MSDGAKKAKVLLSRLGVQKGDLVIPYKEVKYTVPIKQVKGGSGDGSKVVGFNYPNGQIGGVGDVVFLHGDSNPSEGSYIALYQDLNQLSASIGVGDLPRSQKYVATAYTYKSGDNATAAYIVYAEDAVRLNNTAGKVAAGEVGSEPTNNAEQSQSE